MSIIDRLTHVVEVLASQGLRLATYDEPGQYVTVEGLDGTPTKVWATKEG